MSESRPNLLCLAHLGWDYIWQRPQHVLSRLAHHYDIAYINEPEISKEARPPVLQPVVQERHLSAWQPVFPDEPETYERWRAIYRDLVRELLLRKEWVTWQGTQLVATHPLILWFYTPTPVYLLDELPATVVVYDVMDELASFKGAAPDLRAREARLTARADVLFTGGRSLYEARRSRHPNVHLFPSGVDVEHFAQALDPGTPVAPELAALPRPVLGYYGAIDERIDLNLLRSLAERHPDWSIAMIGPVTKIEQSSLPRLPNIYYMGKQPYERLPHFLKAFDVCLMPFALNESTRYISPTKTLEYMAAHRPIVSTPVPDVVSTWGDVVRIAETAGGFAEAVGAALSEGAVDRRKRVAREKRHLARHSWDRIAAEMHKRIEQTVQATGEIETPTMPVETDSHHEREVFAPL